MSDKTQLMKTCSNCGLQKPLSAFLQLAEKGNWAYGGICADCRGILKDAPAISEDSVGGTATGLKIDAKAKTQTEVDSKALQKRTVESDQLERRTQTLFKKQHIQKTKIKASQERSHRENFLNKKSETTTKSTVTSQAQLDQKTANAAAFSAEKRKEEGGVNYMVEVRDTGFSGKIKHHSAVFQQLKTWLGNSHFVRNVEKLKLTRATPDSILAPSNKKSR